MTKVHLCQSRDPLVEFETQTALCLAEVPNAVFTFRWVPGEINYGDLSTIQFCGKCIARLARNGEQSYLYGIKSGEEVKQEAAA